MAFVATNSFQRMTGLKMKPKTVGGGGGVYSGGVLNTVSTSAYNSVNGAYGVKLLNANYTGPIVTLRASTDATGTSTQSFYSDLSGNLTTQYASGISVANWLATSFASANQTYAFITKWYDQSVTYSNHATQTTISYQPIYDISNRVVNFGYTGSSGGVAATQAGYFSLPLNAFPTLDSSFTVVTKYWHYGTNNNDTQGDLIDIVANNQGGAIKMNTNGSPGMWLSGAGPTGTALAASNSVLSYKYTSFTTVGAISNNYVVYQDTVQTGIAQRNSAFNLAQNNPSNGNGPNSYYANSGVVTGSTTNYYLQAQLYYLYIFSSALSNPDRLLIEAT